jgi:hypothetical protein
MIIKVRAVIEILTEDPYLTKTLWIALSPDDIAPKGCRELASIFSGNVLKYTVNCAGESPNVLLIVANIIDDITRNLGLLSKVIGKFSNDSSK